MLTPHLGRFTGLASLCLDDARVLEVGYTLDLDISVGLIGTGSLTLAPVDAEWMQRTTEQPRLTLQIAKVRLRCRIGRRTGPLTCAVDVWLPADRES
jgi:hypothetical protein